MLTQIPLLNRNRTSATAGSRAEHLFVSATFITMLGNNIQLIATSLLVYKTAGTALAVGWVFVLTAIPQALFSAVFGRIADHVDRRKLCVLADTGSALTAFAFPIAILLKANASDTGYVVSFVLALFAAIFMPASNALFKERLPSERMGHFSANYEIAFQAGSLMSGVVGGIVAQVIGLNPLFYFNAATFVGSALCILAVGRLQAAPAPAGPVADAATATTAADGDAEAIDAAVETAVQTAPPASAVRRPVLLLGVLLANGTVLITVVNTLLLVCIVFRFHQGAGLLGVVDALAGVGMLIAATVYRRIKDRVDYRYLILVGSGICAPLTMAEPIAVWVMLPCILVCGVLFGLGRVPTRAELWRGVDPGKAGRTFGTINALALTVSVAATVVVALIVDHHGVVPGFLTLGFLCGAPVWVIGVSLIASKTWAPAPAAARKQPANTATG